MLGALLLGQGEAWDRVADLLSDKDFYRFEHRLIFAAIGRLANANKPADVLTVWEQLQREREGQDITPEYLNQLAQYVPSASNIRRYAEIVRDRARLRQLVAASDQIATLAFNPGLLSAEEVVDQAEAQIFAVSDERQGDDWHDTRSCVVNLLDRMQDTDAPPDYVPTGLADLDKALDGGMRVGEVIVIAARPGHGKTALAITIGDHVALNEGLPVALMSMEMGKEQITRRRMAGVARIPLHKLRNPERMGEGDWPALTEAVEKMAQVQFEVSDKSGLSLNQIRARARGLKRKKGLRVLIIDYIGLMETDSKENRASAIGRISRGLKALARELGITILLLSQLNRGIENRPNKRPIMSDLRESGDIEQDADAILFVYREIIANPAAGDNYKDYGEIIVGKQRDAESGQAIPIGYHGAQLRFYNWTGAKPADMAKEAGATTPAEKKAPKAPNPL